MQTRSTTMSSITKQKKKTKNFYSVVKGRRVGIFKDWSLCEDSIHKFNNSVYKGFYTLTEAVTFIMASETFDNTEDIPVFCDKGNVNIKTVFDMGYGILNESLPIAEDFPELAEETNQITQITLDRREKQEGVVNDNENHLKFSDDNDNLYTLVKVPINIDKSVQADIEIMNESSSTQTDQDLVTNCSPLQSDVLVQISDKLSDIGDFRKIVREMESDLVQKLLREKEENTVLKISAVKTEFLAKIECLKAELTAKNKELDIQNQLIKQLKKDNDSKEAELKNLKSDIEQQKSDQITSVKLPCKVKHKSSDHMIPVAKGSLDVSKNRTDAVPSYAEIASHSSIPNNSESESVDVQIPTENSYLVLDNVTINNVPAVNPINTSIGKLDNVNIDQNNSTMSSTEDVDLLIIGNPNVRKLNASKMYKNKKVVIKELRDKTIKGATDYLKSISKSLCPKVIVFQVAGNSLVHESPEECVRQTTELVVLAEKIFPAAYIVNSDPLPRRFASNVNANNFFEKRKAYSQAIRARGIVSINHDNLPKVKNGYLSDGVHIAGPGVCQLVRNLKIIINPLLGLMEYEKYNGSNNSVPVKGNRSNYQNAGSMKKYQPSNGAGSLLQNRKNSSFNHNNGELNDKIKELVALLQG